MKKSKIVFSIKILFNILLGVCLGSSIILFYVSTNGTLQKIIEENIQNGIQEKYACHCECKLEKIDWLSLRMHFSHMQIKPRSLDEDSSVGKEWLIAIDKGRISCSWWSLITSFRCKISTEFDHMVMQEVIDQGGLGLIGFIKKLFVRGLDDIIQYDGVAISNALLSLTKKNNKAFAHIPFICNMSCEPERTRMQFYAKKGRCSYNNICLEDISGSFVWDVPSKDIVKNMSIQTHIGMNIPSFSQSSNCFLMGSMNNGLGSFVLKNEDESFVIDPIQIRADSQKGWFDFSIITNSDFCKQLNLHEACQDVYGNIQIDCRGDFYDFLKTLEVDISIEDIFYKTKNILHEGKAFIQYKTPGLIHGQLVTQNKQWFEFIIDSKDEALSFEFFNSKELEVAQGAHWKVPEQKCNIVVTKSEEKGWYGSYQVELYNQKLNEQKNIIGSFEVGNNDVRFLGNIDDINYDISFQIGPNILLNHILFKQLDKELVTFRADKNNKTRLLGVIDFACIKYLVSSPFKVSFSQEGSLEFRGYVQDGIYYSQLSTKNANIRLPKIYNVVQNITAGCLVDLYNRSVQFKDIKAELHEGEIACSQANLFFDRSGNCFFMHVPLFLHNVLLSWEKGIFMLLSGGLFLNKSKNKNLCLSGNIIVEKSQFKDNILSLEFQEKLLGKVLDYNDKEATGSHCELDISIFTKDLLQVKTSFLSAKARVDIALQGTVKKPELTGLVQLTSGSFYFPYKSLDIIDGRLFFVPGQQSDPLIEILAKGKLKRFSVTMRASGSVFDPYVLFESMPYLTEEQIMSLLLLGMEDSSLGMMVPAILTQKFKDIVFGPALSKTKLQTRFDYLLNSLKYFRFLPQLTSQTGRGGMRGIFEIDASDHLHGKIDTNFMHLEDTKFDVDFGVTDDITFRVQKDGPSTYGGEVELRWKFK